MEYFAGLDVSMAETQVCVMARNGAVIHKANVPSTPADIAAKFAQFRLQKDRIRDRPNGADSLPWLRQLGLVICIESRQAYQALKLLATHKTDHNDPRGLHRLSHSACVKSASARHRLNAKRCCRLLATLAAYAAVSLNSARAARWETKRSQDAA